jgi:hypothetical protein
VVEGVGIKSFKEILVSERQAPVILKLKNQIEASENCRLESCLILHRW